MKTQYKVVIVVFISVGLSTLGIYASDHLRGIEGEMFGLAGTALGPCGEGEVQLNLKGSALCLDIYEASPADNCPVAIPQSQVDTKQNIETAECLSQSKKGVLPWRFVSHTEAQQLCARSGKRLLTNEEWYGASSGITNSNQCAVDERGGSAVETGLRECRSPLGVYDMIGNVWEWIDEEVTHGVYKGRNVPQSGYVALVDGEGFVLETQDTPHDDFGNDYAWTSADGVLGVVRGGFYGSKDDAGLFAVNATVSFDFRSAGIGFRCVRDI